MTEPRDPATTTDLDVAVAQLISNAGRRMEPPLVAYERALAAATVTWQAKVRRRSRQRWMSAAAACVAMVTFAALWVRNADDKPAPTPAVVARTDRIVGTLEALDSDDRWTSVQALTDLHAPVQLRTPPGSLAGLLLLDGASLRVGDGTSIVLESGARIRLLSGRIYLDSGAAHSAPQYEVVTAAGRAVDIGTQFEVQYRDHSYRLRVREGRVRLNGGAGSIESRSGEQVSIDARGIMERTALPKGDDDWQWIQTLAPTPDIDGQPLSALLAWVARETGRTIRFEDPGLERKAQTTILHGNIRLLTPLDALSVMLATTDLEHVLVDEHTILIRSKAAH
jgi:ferric-dicitrate binding protein FerR (iron transport regulator)